MEGTKRQILRACGERTMPSWLGPLFWLLIGLSVAGIAVLSASDLPPAAAVQQATVAALPEGWTFPAGCLPW